MILISVKVYATSSILRIKINVRGSLMGIALAICISTNLYANRHDISLKSIIPGYWQKHKTFEPEAE